MSEQRGRVLGIGGVFFKSDDPAKLRSWYVDKLRFPTDSDDYVTFPWRSDAAPDKRHMTVWSIFPSDTDYFNPSGAPLMVNYIVDDLDALLERLESEGVKIARRTVAKYRDQLGILPARMRKRV